MEIYMGQKRILLFALFPLLLAPALPDPACGENDTGYSATLVESKGEVFLQKPEEELWLPVEQDIPLEQGDRIKTGIERKKR